MPFMRTRIAMKSGITYELLDRLGGRSSIGGNFPSNSICTGGSIWAAAMPMYRLKEAGTGSFGSVAK